MPNFPSTQFPYLQQMDAVIQLEVALCGKEDLSSLCLKQAIRTQTPATVILKTVKDMATDNRTAVEDMIGIKLTSKILAL